jgi:hypothetical protein
MPRTRPACYFSALSEAIESRYFSALPEAIESRWNLPYSDSETHYPNAVSANSYAYSAPDDKPDQESHFKSDASSGRATA